MKKILSDAELRHLEDEIFNHQRRGEIDLLGQRMLLMHGFSLASLRRETIERLGIKVAREIFTRLGYQQGAEDALRLKEHGITDLQELLACGPRIREMEGFVLNRAVERMQYDEDTGEFWGDYFWESSWEAKAHIDHLGISGTPSCWLMTGYACGFTTMVMGRPIVWKEVECACMGHQHCRVIGMPLEDEEDAREHLSFLSVDDFVATPKPQRSLLASSGLSVGNSSSTEDSSLSKGGPSSKNSPSIEPSPSTDEYALPDIVGSSREFNRVAAQLRKVAVTQSTVLLKGESGVGKERFSRALHSISSRSEGPFISVNCAAIPADLVEAELFGVEKGAYTGAVESRQGKFERADGGTLFLDEISSLPLEAQGKLLRALQEKEIERVGGSSTKKINVRIVAAANTNLIEDIKAGNFRADLYYRINIFPINIPPLRDRKEDISLLVNLFIQRFSDSMQKNITGMSRKAFNKLLNHHWPGNVRELENICERAVILAESNGNIDLQHILMDEESLEPEGLQAAFELSDERAIDHIISNISSYEEIEEQILKHALHKTSGNISAAARFLNLRRGQFEYRLKKHQII